MSNLEKGRGKFGALNMATDTSLGTKNVALLVTTLTVLDATLAKPCHSCDADSWSSRTGRRPKVSDGANMFSMGRWYLTSVVCMSRKAP